jgi:uncharacterized cupredoxin-like copper-binding protein
MHRTHLWVTCLALGLAAPAWAHGDAAHMKPAAQARKATKEATKEQKDWGIAGDAKAVRRTIEIRMSDDMRFTPDRIEVRQGDTLRLRVRNAGRAMHEFVIGTKEENAQHAALMMKFPDMEHDEPHMAHVAPGKTGEVVWTFNRAGEFEFACLMAGHYAAGMVGTIKVTTK